ncbi:Vacuolar amino acid transporter 2 [Symbiodinium microadriaticum]|uniref:Vacuolar amino acid transporter 2 n=2 Tax=Symbiodinium TaxID=2949 RepID=A0A1Q9DHX7_SYMMI|nr:Vacuolar amino acid transporter 2 [Symbiodinium microadriaticum]
MNPAYPSAPSVLQSQLNHGLLPREQREDGDSSVAAIQEEYLRHLSQDRLVQGGYVPNLVPILLWDRPATGVCRQAPPGAGPISDPGSPRRRLPVGDPITPAVAKTKSQPASRGFFRRGSLRSSIVNIAAAALGAGALSLPRAMYYSGIIWGPLLMIILAVLSIMSIRLIVQLVELSGKDSYEEIAKEAIGPWFALLVEVNIVLFCFGTAVAYMITVGQVSHQVLDAAFGDAPAGSWLSSLTQSNTVLLWTTALVLLPLSLLDSINDLRFASLAGVTCILYLILVVLYVFAKQSISPTLTDSDSFAALSPKGGITGCFKMLSLSIFAFCCQPNVPSIYTELEQKSYQRMQKVSTRAMLLCCVVYLMMGVTGFLAFGEDTLGNILGNLQPMLCANDWMVRSGMASMAFAVTMAYPLNIFPIRFSVETALFYHRPSLNCSAVRTGIAVGAVASSLIVAIALPQINLIFELIGATTGSFVCFIGPGLLFQRTVPGHVFAPHKLKALLLIVMGSLFLLLGTYSSVLDVLAQLSEGSSSGTVQCKDFLPAIGHVDA